MIFSESFIAQQLNKESFCNRSFPLCPRPEKNPENVEETGQVLVGLYDHSRPESTG